MIRQLALLVLVVAGCGDQISIRDGASCTDSTGCVLGDVQGTCQSTGFCSYPDPTCGTDGQRYSAGATGLANQCLGGSCGAADEACCESDVCGANLTCDNGMCTCGADEGAPCCDGTTCAAGLGCAAGTCVAGFEQITLGRASACALRTDDAVMCWGYDALARARSQPASMIRLAPFERTVVPITGVASVRRADTHACALKTDGTVWCWGHNDRGQFGDGTTTSSIAPVQVPGLTSVTHLGIAKVHACAAGTFGGATGIFCWGIGKSGRLGNGASADSLTPLAVDMTSMADAGQTVRTLETGSYSSCAVMSDNRMWCWGRNNRGELGDNTQTVATAPRLVDLSQITLGEATIDQVAMSSMRNGHEATCMRLSTGTLYCWGTSSYGTNGDGVSAEYRRPTAPVSMTDLGGATFTSVVASGDVNCGLDSMKRVWCWGRNKNGALGNNGQEESNERTPVLVLGLPATITSIARGHHSTCAIDEAKHLWCWGANRNGHLTSTKVPTTEQTVLEQAVDVTY